MSTPWTPPFLVKLGLDADNADAREVRRAYAQRLKQIDQAADPEGFQALRTAYESALAWLARQVSAEVAPPAQQPPSAAEEPDPQPSEIHASTAGQSTAAPGADLDPRRLGDLVFSEFSTTGFVATEVQLRQRLEKALADQRLINIEARTWFEWRVASLLLDGWQAGHEVLFVCACECFNWEKDQRRLTLFGRAGAALDAAIREQLTFQSQHVAKADLQRRLIRELRTGSMPSSTKLVHALPSLQDLMQRYPHWLRIIAPHGRYLEWCAAYKAIEPNIALATPASSPGDVEASRDESGFPGMVVLMLILVVVALILGSAQRQTSSPTSWEKFAKHQPQGSASGPLPLAPFGTAPTAWTKSLSSLGSGSSSSNGVEQNPYGLSPPLDFSEAKIITKRASSRPQAPGALEPAPPQQPVIGVPQKALDTGALAAGTERPQAQSAEPVQPARDAPAAQFPVRHDWRDSLTTKPRTTPPTGDWRDSLTPSPSPSRSEWKPSSLPLIPGEQGASAPERRP